MGSDVKSFRYIGEGIICFTKHHVLQFQIVAIDRKNGLKLMSFQELSSRERGSKDSLIAVDKIKVI